ncbi:hypothetical protein AD950_08025 [Gluconobacter oxydans]|nr:hypothetical protein AD950_08025 [Gluconobacter oxydans]
MLFDGGGEKLDASQTEVGGDFGDFKIRAFRHSDQHMELGEAVEADEVFEDFADTAAYCGERGRADVAMTGHTNEKRQHGDVGHGRLGLLQA